MISEIINTGKIGTSKYEKEKIVFAFLLNILGDAAVPQCPMQYMTNSRYSKRTIWV